MSFGLLKHFKEAKGHGPQANPAKHIRHIIIGQDLGAVLKLVELKKKYPDETTKLITTRPINRQTLIENYDYGVTQLRSPEAVENIYRKFHHARILPHAKEASFYKDGKFHDFGGRAKSMDLKSGEEYFTHKGYKLELSSLFSEADWENLDSLLNEHADIRIFEGIEKVEPSDLVEKSEWKLTFKDFSVMTCENLYVSMSPKKFLNFVQHKEKVTKDLIDLCTAVHVQAAISLTWSLDKEIYPEEKTLFIPQSMTHEWGHFLVEFEPYNYQKKEQLCHVLFLIHEEEPQSEDLASKIKLMKRVLDRVFPDIEKHIKKEHIRFDDEMFISDVKDASKEQLSFDYPTLKFLGQTAPVTASFSGEKFLSRTLLS